MKRSSGYYQQGSILLMLTATLVLGLAWLSYQIYGQLGSKLKKQNAQEVMQVLNDAKQNLLAFSTNMPSLYPNSCASGAACGIGFFPTPDVNNTGAPAGTTGSILGRLPARQQGANYFFFHVRDIATTGTFLDSPYPIWYVLPSTMGVGLNTVNLQVDSNLSTKPILNSNTLAAVMNLNPNAVCRVPNGVCLDSSGAGTSASTSPVVALLIYAGGPLVSQVNRPSNNASDYLDMSNADGDNVFLQQFPVGQVCQQDPNQPSACFNDQVVAITLQDWQNAMESRVRAEFGDLTTTLCDATWRNANTTHWAVVNRWYDVTNLCP